MKYQYVLANFQLLTVSSNTKRTQVDILIPKNQVMQQIKYHVNHVLQIKYHVL